VAKIVAPDLSGKAIKQHLVKVCKFRDEDGEKVPPKLDRNQRRKAFAAPTASVTTPARGRSKKVATKNDNADDDKSQRLTEQVKPGRSLLYKKPASKSKRAPKQETTTKPPAVGRGGGRRKTQPQSQSEAALLEVKSKDLSDTEYDAPKAKPVGLGGKGGRESKRNGDEDDEDVDRATPSKKSKRNDHPQTKSSSRAREAVDHFGHDGARPRR